MTGTPVVLALGSNLGDRLTALRRAVVLLTGDDPEAFTLPGPPLRCQAMSGVWETVPVGGPPQDEYLNAVVTGEWAGTAEDLLYRALSAESVLGRVRVERWGPRTLDVDLIAVGDERRDDPELTLPHPGARERAFVLAPWAEADPGAVLPGYGPVAALLGQIDTSGVRRLPGVSLDWPREGL